MTMHNSGNLSNSNGTSTHYAGDTNVDAFHGVTGVLAFRVISVLALLLVLSAGNLLVAGLMWYEKWGRDQQHTLINQLTFRVYVFVVIGNLSAVPVDYLRIAMGRGLPSVCCQFKVGSFISFIKFSI